MSQEGHRQGQNSCRFVSSTFCRPVSIDDDQPVTCAFQIKGGVRVKSNNVGKKLHVQTLQRVQLRMWFMPDDLLARNNPTRSNFVELARIRMVALEILIKCKVKGTGASKGKHNVHLSYSDRLNDVRNYVTTSAKDCANSTQLRTHNWDKELRTTSVVARFTLDKASGLAQADSGCQGLQSCLVSAVASWCC